MQGRLSRKKGKAWSEAPGVSGSWSVEKGRGLLAEPPGVRSKVRLVWSVREKRVSTRKCKSAGLAGRWELGSD